MSEPYAQPPPQAPPGNAIGIAGFVVSLVGIITCGALSPIGLILSLIGLGKEPKGFAIAGSIISGIGTIGLVVMVGLVVFLIPKGKVTATEVIVERAVSEIETRAAETGMLPSAEEGRELIAEFDDLWGNALRYAPRGNTFTVGSAGPDAVFDTADDIVSTGESRPER